MKFKIGDKVKFLNDSGGGVVTTIIDSRKVGVLSEDGFVIPTLVNELIFDGNNDFFPNDSDDKTRDKVVVKNKKKPIEPQDEVPIAPTFEKISFDDDDYEKPDDTIDIYLGFVPLIANKPTESDLEVYLINDSNYNVTFNYMKPFSGLYNTIIGAVAPNTKEIIDTINRHDINDLGKLNFQFLFSKSKPHALRSPQEAELKIHPPKFFIETSYKENDFFDEHAIVFPLLEENSMSKAIKNLTYNYDKGGEHVVSKKDVTENKKHGTKHHNEKIVVDLHIQELLDDERGLTPHEMFEIQMKKFREEMTSAIKNPYAKRIIFIHGRGNGVLKEEIRRELSRKFPKYQYQDASFEEYGFGATMVLLK